MTTNRELAAALQHALEDDAPSVPLKALIAAAVVCARGGAPTRAGMAKVAHYSYGSSQNHYGELLTTLVARVPEVVASMATGMVDPALASQLRADLQQRNDTIAALRAELAQLTERHAHIRNYALALHAELRATDSGVSGMAHVLHLHPTTPTAPHDSEE